MKALLQVALAVVLAKVSVANMDLEGFAAMKAEFAAMKAEMKAEFAAMKADNAAMKAENAAMKVQLSIPTAGELKIFVDGRTKCPHGTFEPNVTKGMMLVGKPAKGATGAIYNRPFDAGEIGRVPTHSHAISVNDAGHNHVNMVNDPGHGHSSPWSAAVGGPVVGAAAAASAAEHLKSTIEKTGISVDTMPAKSNIEVIIDSNEAGEHLPLVYVLICQTN